MILWAPLLRKAFLLSLVGLTAWGAPGLAPSAGSLETIIRVTLAVVRRLRQLHQLRLPDSWRQPNWLGPRNQGSCVHASMVHLFHWQGRHDLAQWWRAAQADGETPRGLSSKLTAARIPFAETRTGDVQFLEWAIRTRRGAAVVVADGQHMVTLVGLDPQSAWLLDSNAPQQIQRHPRAQFLAEWRQSGGWSVTFLGVPPAPPPWMVQSDPNLNQELP